MDDSLIACCRPTDDGGHEAIGFDGKVLLTGKEAEDANKRLLTKRWAMAESSPDSISNSSTQALIDEIRDRMAGMSAIDRSDIVQKIMDGYEREEPLYGDLWELTH